MQYLVAVLALFAAAQAAPQSPYLIPQESFLPKAIPTLQANGHLADTPAVAAAKEQHLQAHAQALGLAPVPPTPVVNAAPAALPAQSVSYIQPAVSRIAPTYLNAAPINIPQIQTPLNRIAPAYLNTPTIPLTYVQPAVKSNAPVYAYAHSYVPNAYRYL